MSRIDDFIATIHPYDSLPQDERARVARSFGRRHWRAGSVIYRQGEALPGEHRYGGETLGHSERQE